MKNKFKYVSDISNETFETHIVLPFINEEGRPCILIKNSKNKLNIVTGSTDNLEYHLNSLFVKDNKQYYFHMISCLKNDGYSKEQFDIAYEYLFKTMNEPKSDFEIGSLINSLEQLFKITPEKDMSKLHTGVYGELLFVLYTHECGCKEILSKYHSNFYSKHDLEIDRYNRIEVKSSVDFKRIHHFSHDQIFRKDVHVYVASVLLEQSSEGVTLNELFERVLNLSLDPKTTLWFGQLKGFCGISQETPGPSFSFDKAKQDLKIFNANDLPHLELEGIKGISNVSYNVDCSMTDNIEIINFVNHINDIIVK